MVLYLLELTQDPSVSMIRRLFTSELLVVEFWKETSVGFHAGSPSFCSSCCCGRSLMTIFFLVSCERRCAHGCLFSTDGSKFGQELA